MCLEQKEPAGGRVGATGDGLGRGLGTGPVGRVWNFIHIIEYNLFLAVG